MFRFRTLLRRAALAALPPFLALVHGCSMGFTSLHPGENSALYAPLFEDVLAAYDEPHWLWVRGTISGDLDGDGAVDEEVVLATIQKGDERRPGPIEAALLVACRVGPDGGRAAIARKLLFDSSPVPAAPKPENDLGIVEDRPFTRCRAQMVQDKASLKETVVVYFWAEPLPSSVWFAGFALTPDGWERNLETVLRQSTPGFITANLDRSIGANPFGYQLLFGVAAIPEGILAKLEATPHETPLWGHVYARNAAGVYEQADARFAGNFRDLEAGWNRMYLKAVIKNLPPEELAWFEYHMGVLNYYAGSREMAEGFLAKADKAADDPVLRRALDAALALPGIDPLKTTNATKENSERP